MTMDAAVLHSNLSSIHSCRVPRGRHHIDAFIQVNSTFTCLFACLYVCLFVRLPSFHQLSVKVYRRYSISDFVLQLFLLHLIFYYMIRCLFVCLL